jgi:hypothetical protein
MYVLVLLAAFKLRRVGKLCESVRITMFSFVVILILQFVLGGIVHCAPPASAATASVLAFSLTSIYRGSTVTALFLVFYYYGQGSWWQVNHLK